VQSPGEALLPLRSAIEARVRRYDLMALEAQSRVRLITTSKDPPLRGTRFSFGELDYLCTTGYISALKEFHGMHVPAPLQVADHIGQDSSRDVLLKEGLEHCSGYCCLAAAVRWLEVGPAACRCGPRD
jgi:hypothetical protein